MTSVDKETKELIDRMTDAVGDVVECMRLLAKGGDNLVSEVLRRADFIEWEHYPPDDRQIQ